MDETTAKRFEEVYSIAENALSNTPQTLLPFRIVDAYTCDMRGISLELEHEGRTYFLQLQEDGTFMLAVFHED
jgi:hypothetical protein